MEIHRRAMENITREMAATLVRTSGSPAVTEAMDFSTCLLDPDGEQLSLVAHMLKHSASSLIGTETLVTKLRETGHEPRPGDGWLVNDPYYGGAMHQGDIAVIMPQFHNGQHVGFGFANLHVLDIGGGSVSGFNPGARSVYEEGLRFPLLHMIADGRLDPTWEEYIAANVRLPGIVLNDIRSMIAANNVAERKLRTVLDRYGWERHLAYARETQDSTERLLRERIASIPDGVYESVDWSEYDGHGPDELLELSLRLEVDGSDLSFTFAGVPQVDSYMNSSVGGMTGAVMSALMTTLSYGDLPFNAGIWRPISVDLGPPGSIVNAVAPAPVSATHAETGLRAVKLVKDVLVQAYSLSSDPLVRRRIAGQGHDGAGTIGVTGSNQHGTTSVVYYLDTAVGQGGGAQSSMDGQDAYGATTMVGCGMADVELHEAMDPVLFLWRRILAGSGGPGTYRGGQGIDQALAILYTDRMRGWARTQCAEVPPRGFGGGFPASASSVRPIIGSNVTELLDEGIHPLDGVLRGSEPAIRNKQTPFEVGRGDVVRFLPGGGGGLGDPLLRDPERVRSDVKDGYVSERQALDVYGVLLDANERVDSRGTAAQRERLLAERVGRQPPRALRAPADPGVMVRLEAGSGNEPDWVCGSCGELLAPADMNWRSGSVVLRETPVGQRYGQLGLRVRERTEDPQVVVREHFCAGCAGCLSVDITLAERPPMPAPRLVHDR